MKTRYVIQFSDNVYPRKWYDLDTHEYTNSFATRKDALVQLEIERNNDESGEYAYRVTMKCEYYIVQVKIYRSLGKPRRIRWKGITRRELYDYGGECDELVKRFETREQAELAIKQYNDAYKLNRHRYRIVHCEVVT